MVVTRRLINLLSVCSIFISAGVLTGFCRGAVWAEEKTVEESRGESSGKDTTYGMEGVIVVAPPVIEGNQIDRLGSQVTVVTEKQIEDLNAQDLPSALRKTPGVVVSHHNPVGSFGGGEGCAVFIRGMGISRPGAEIEVLVDGIPKFVSVWTHPLMDVLSVDIIDQMRV